MQPPRPWFHIDVAAYGHHGRDALQFVQHIFRAHVSGMENQFAAAQRFPGLRSQQSMRVADDADAHAGTMGLHHLRRAGSEAR